MPDRYFIIGDPVSHSISPCIHNALFSRYSIDGVYEAVRVVPEDLHSFFRTLPDRYRGGNITVPHKVAAIKFMDEMGEEAFHIGAINTVTVLPDGRLKGNNTDGSGFVHSLRIELGGEIPEPVVLIGAGGASRGIVFGLASEGVRELFIANRTVDTARTVSRNMMSRFEGVDIAVSPLRGELFETFLTRAGLVINASSIGLVDDFLDFPFHKLKKDTTVVDIVYRMGRTHLIEEALKRGFPCIDAFPMLAAQAAFAFQCWTEILPDYHVVKEITMNCFEREGDMDKA